MSSRLFTLAKPAKSSIIVNGISVINGTNTTFSGNGTSANPLQINAIWPQFVAGANIILSGNGQPTTPYRIAANPTLIYPGDDINVSGNGSTANPYVISNPSPASSIIGGAGITVTGTPPTISLTSPTTIQIFYLADTTTGWSDNNGAFSQYSFVTLISGSADPLGLNRPSCVFNNLSLSSIVGASTSLNLYLYYDEARTIAVNWTDAQMIDFVPASWSAMGSLSTTSPASQSAWTLNPISSETSTPVAYPRAAFVLSPPYGFTTTSANTVSGFLPPGQSSAPTSNAVAYFDYY